MKRHRMLRALKFFVFAVLAAAVLSLVVMSLWNWLMPAIFGSRLITFWQALGLLVLARILFGRRSVCACFLGWIRQLGGGSCLRL